MARGVALAAACVEEAATDDEVTPTGWAWLVVEHWSLSRAQSARPTLSVEKATSPPSPLKRALRAISFSSGSVDSAEATSATFATAVGERPSRDCFPLT
eukprot:424521-Pleurochrysis_carterae.AAC.1